MEGRTKLPSIFFVPHTDQKSNQKKAAPKGGFPTTAIGKKVMRAP